MIDSKFDNIRPYNDSEIPAAMQRIADSELFPALSSYVFPGMDIETVRRHIRSIETIAQFQKEVMVPVNEQIIRRSIDRFSYSGLEHLQPGTPYLFVSNHRDIMLDSSLLQYLLLTHGLDTSEITFGANLMTHPLVVDIGKSNKMFRIERSGDFKRFYQSSILNSEYIRHTIRDRHCSVWIAQRNGRTKDGLDRTEPGLISMFISSFAGDKISAIRQLNIVPVSISYEWETCDMAKALELYESRFTKYVKEPGEDVISIISGIALPKGHIHLEICRPLTHSELIGMEHLAKNDYVKAVASLIDSRINSAYMLHPNNYIAFDLRYGTDRYSDRYNDTQKGRFMQRLNRLSQFETYDYDILRDIFLSIYSNPLTNRRS